MLGPLCTNGLLVLVDFLMQVRGLLGVVIKIQQKQALERFLRDWVMQVRGPSMNRSGLCAPCRMDIAGSLSRSGEKQSSRPVAQ